MAGPMANQVFIAARRAKRLFLRLQKTRSKRHLSRKVNTSALGRHKAKIVLRPALPSIPGFHGPAIRLAVVLLGPAGPSPVARLSDQAVIEAPNPGLPVVSLDALTTPSSANVEFAFCPEERILGAIAFRAPRGHPPEIPLVSSYGLKLFSARQTTRPWFPMLLGRRGRWTAK